MLMDLPFCNAKPMEVMRLSLTLAWVEIRCSVNTRGGLRNVFSIVDLSGVGLQYGTVGGYEWWPASRIPIVPA